MLKPEWSRTFYAAVRKDILRNVESIDQDTIEFAPGLAYDKADKTSRRFPTWAAEYPVIAIVKFEATAVEIISTERAAKDLAELNEYIAKDKKKCATE